MIQTDVLVLGSGIAGLSYALRIARRIPECQVTIITKADESESNTKYAQGGVAAVIDDIADSYEKHIEDTLKAGDGLCDHDVVELVVKEGPARLDELVRWGIDFDKASTGDFDLGLEGGHSEHRILHHKDITGLEIERKLIAQIKERPNIKVKTQHFVVDLITQHHLGQKVSKADLTCYGAYVFDEKSKRIEAFGAKITLLATGGVGQVYRNTTNPMIATGDGIAMAYRAKARISGMEFVQFHPTALAYRFDHGRSFLISEAVRGFGARLRNKANEFFMDQYDERGELASRDIVSRAIDAELKKYGDEHVYLDCRDLDMGKFKQHFPTIYDKCAELGLDLEKDMIPVTPAAHYLCGGVEVDLDARTSIKNLLACGECTQTGLHGANRLASNSLLEALVYAKIALDTSVDLLQKEDIETTPLPEWDEKGTIKPRELILITHNRKEVQSIMSDLVGIIRTNERLKMASRRLSVIFEETEDLYKRSKVSPQLFELRNMISTAYLIVEQSKKRKENRGGFFNADLSEN